MPEGVSDYFEMTHYSQGDGRLDLFGGDERDTRRISKL